MTAPAPAPTDKVPKFGSDLPPSRDGESFEIYRRNSAPMCRIVLPGDMAPSDFWFKSTMLQLPHAVLFRACAPGHRMVRGPEEIALGATHIMLVAQVSGDVECTCAGRHVRLRPGDLGLYDYSQGYDSVTTDFEMMGLMVGRDRVPPVFLGPLVHGAVLPAENAATKMIIETMASLIRTGDAMTLAEADAVIDATFVMAGGALQGVLAARDGTQPHPSDNAQIKKALAFIDRHMRDANLTPAKIEAHLRLSRSSLYRLFAPHGGVGAVILRRRLDRAMKALLIGASSRPALHRIAEDLGFRSEAHFSRAFRTRFGVSPRAFQQTVLRKDYAALAAQAERVGFTSLRSWIEYLSHQFPDSGGED